MIDTTSIKKNYTFRLVYRKGKSLAGKVLVMYVLKNGLSESRLGVTVSKRVGCAVVRNKVKRRIKESVRTTQCKVKKGFDIVVVARAAASSAPFGDISADISRLFKRHGVTVKDGK